MADDTSSAPEGFTPDAAPPPEQVAPQQFSAPGNPVQMDNPSKFIPGVKMTDPSKFTPAGKPNTPPAFKGLSDQIKVSKFEDAVQTSAKKYNIDPNWIRAIHSIEDPSDDPGAVSSAGAVGEMQLLPGTFDEYKPGSNSKITDPAANIEAGVHYFSHLLRTFGGNVDAALEAYNEGEGNLQAGKHYNPAYSKEVEQQYSYAIRDGFGASAPTFKKALSLGTPQKIDPSKLVPELAPRNTGTFGDRMEGDLQEGQHQAAYLTSKAFKSLPPDQQKNIANMLTSAPVTKAEDGVNLLTQAMDAMTYDQYGAMLRDYSEGKGFNNWGSLNTALVKAMANPKTAGQVLGAMQEKYGLNTRENTQYWMTRPGMREMIAKADVRNPEEAAFKIMAGLAADNARFVVNHPAVAGLETFVGEWFNPAWKAKPIENTFGLMRGATKATVDIARDGSKPEQAFAAFVDSTSDKAHAFANRYYKMGKKFGVQGENAQAKYVDSQYATHKTVSDRFVQPHTLGLGTKEQRNAVWMEHDRFANADYTLHQQHSAFHSSDEPYHDPVTNTTSMQKGPVLQGSWDNHSFAKHDPDTATKVVQGQEGEAMFGPSSAARQWNAIAGKASNARSRAPGDIATSVAMLNVPWKDAEQFESNVLAQARRMPGALQDPYISSALRKRALGEYMRTNGKTSVEWMDKPNGRAKEVILPSKTNGLTRDNTVWNGFTHNKHAENTDGAMRQMDDYLATIAPGEQKYFLSGYWPRSGAFREKPTPEQMQAGGQSLAGKPSGGGNPSGVNKQQRTYKSIQEALDDGMEINPDFDSADSIVRHYAKQAQFTNYVKFAQKYGTPIDYKAAIKDAYEGPTLKPFDFANTGGPDGFSEFNKWAAEEAAEEIKQGIAPKYSTAQTSIMDDKQLAEATKKVATDVMQKVETTWKRNNPDKTWRADQELGVNSLAGYAIPHEVRDAALDGHPAFQPGKTKNPTELWQQESDARQNVFQGGLENVTRGMRSALFLDTFYHPWRNLARIGFIHGKMNPLQLAQVLFHPTSVDPAILLHAEEDGALHSQFSAGGSNQQSNIRNAFAEGPRPTAIVDPSTRVKALWGSKMNPANLPTRLKTVIEGLKNVTGPDATKAANAQHWLSKAWYNLDQDNQEMVFGVFEDVMSAVNHSNMVKEAQRKGMSEPDARAWAGREVRRQFGDSHNISQQERAAGAQKMVWFYAWMRGQWKLWSRVLTKDNVAKGATVPTAAAQSVNAMQPDTDPGLLGDSIIIHQGDKQYALSIGGPERKAMALLGLASAPIQGVSAGDDFMRYFTQDIAYSAVPAMKLIVRGFETAMMPGAEPTETGALFDKDLPAEDRLMQLGQQAAGSLLPTIGSALGEAKESKGLTLLNLLGYNARRVDNQGENLGLNRAIRKLRGVEHTLQYLHRKDPAARSEDIQTIGPNIYNLEQLKAQNR